MKAFKLVISLLLLVPTNWALSMASSGSTSVSSSSLSLSPPSSTGGGSTKDSAAATLGDLYRKSRQSRCVRCYDDRYGDDYDRTRYGGSVGGSGGGYTSRTNDDRPSNWYYPSERYDRYDDRDRVRYGGARDYDRYYYPYNGYYRDRTDDRYSTRTYDRYDRDRYDSRYPYDRSPSENRGYGYDNRDRYYSNDRYNDYYRGGDRYADRNRDSSYDRYGQDDRYYTRYDYRNYRPWDETYRGQSGFDNSGRGYYFANDRPNDYYKPPYRPDARPSGPSTPGPTYLPRDPYEQSRPSGSYGGYPDSRPGTSSSPSSSSSSASSSSSMASSSPGSDYGNRPRDDVNGGSGGGSPSGGDNKNGYSGSSGGGGGSWSYVNDREKDASYKGGIRDKDNQSSSYGSGGRGRPLGGSYLLDRDSNVPEGGVMMNNQDKPDDSKINDSPMASKLSSESSKSMTNDRMAETKDTN